jgi:hypothetical protein
MKALTTEKSGDYTIITGVTQLVTDTEATKAASIGPLSRVEEAIQMHAKHREKGRYIQEAVKAGERAKEAGRQAAVEIKKPVYDEKNPQHKTMRSDMFRNDEIVKKCQTDYTQYSKERADKYGAAGVLNTELIELDKIVTEKHKDIKRSNPVFCHPSGNCIIDRGTPVAGWMPEHVDESGATIPAWHAIMEDSELEADGALVPEGQTVDGLTQAWMSKGEHKACTVTGEYVDDYRGLVYHCKTGDTWGKRTIVALGEFPGATEILDSDLTDIQRAEIHEQQETERIAAMTEAERLAEYEVKKSELAQMAQVMENELKFDGVADYAAQAQAWYDIGLAGLKGKYGIE